MMTIKRIITILLSLMLIAAFAGCATIESDWHRTKRENTKKAYKAFLAKHADSEFSNEAKQKIEEISWHETKTVNTQDAYRSFISSYPSGDLAQEARVELEKSVWREIGHSDTLKLYDDYLREFPNGKHVEQAELRIKLLINPSLMEAASEGKLVRVRALIERGADVNTRDPSSKTVLMRTVIRAAMNAGSLSVRWSGKRNPNYMKIVRLLLDNGADIHLKDDDGKTALDYASSKLTTSITDQGRTWKRTYKVIPDIYDLLLKTYSLKEYGALDKRADGNDNNISTAVSSYSRRAGSKDGVVVALFNRRDLEGSYFYSLDADYDDWLIEMGDGEIEMESILELSKNQEGQYTGQWFHLWGMIEIKNIKYEDNQLSFTYIVRDKGNERTNRLTGVIEQGELSGVLISGRDETEIKGRRVPRTPRGIGSWDVKIKVDEIEHKGTLTITANEEGNLIGMWKSASEESRLSEVKYKDRKLAFTILVKREGMQVEMAFERTVGETYLEGVYKSNSGEATVTVARIGASVIGTWDLNIESEHGPIKSRLRVNPDMSALYGPTLIKKINLDGDKVSFKCIRKLVDKAFETSFEGKVVESKLTGELKNPLGLSKVTGTRRLLRAQ